MRLSLCMIVKDEAQTLGRCLSSFSPVVDEIIVADTGSSDNTREIARSFGATVIETPWNDSFSEARNRSLRRATAPWTMWADADDFCPEACHTRIRALLHTVPDRAFSFRLTCMRPNGVAGSSVNQVRLFPNSNGVYFRYRVHESVEHSLREQNIPVEQTGIEIVHEGYMQDHPEKNERNLRLIRADLAEHPGDPRPHYYHACALLAMRDLESAKRAFLDTVACTSAEQETRNIAEMSYIMLADITYALKDPGQARQYVNKGLALNPDSVKLNFYRAEFLFGDNDFSAAEKVYYKLLYARPRQENVPVNVRDIKLKCAERISQIRRISSQVWQTQEQFLYAS